MYTDILKVHLPHIFFFFLQNIFPISFDCWMGNKCTYQLFKKSNWNLESLQKKIIDILHISRCVNLFLYRLQQVLVFAFSIYIH